MSELGVKLADHVVAGQRQLFARVFDEVAPPLANGGKLTFAFIALGADLRPLGDRDAYAAAFNVAAAGLWLSRLVQRGADTGALSQEIFDVAAEHDADLKKLQGFTSIIHNLANADRIRVGLIRCLPKVCFIRTGPNTGGSGFLVGPDTIVTAWHVIAPLLNSDSGEPEPNIEDGVDIVFDYHAPGVGGFKAAKKYKPAKDWLLDHSPCTAEEAKRQAGVDHMFDWISNDYSGGNYLDFAAIRVAGSPGRERGAIALKSDAAHKPAGNLFLLQHPSSSEQSLSMGAYNMPALKSGAPPRFNHLADAAGGSSGGLCLDDGFRPFGLHQAVIRTPQGVVETNVGVPGASIAEHLVEALTPDPTGDPIWQLREDGHPVLGREKFVQLLPSVISGARPILIVRGEPKSGLSFSLRILRQVVAGEHHFVELKAEDIPSNARDLALAILGQCGEAPNTEPVLPASQSSATTTSAWLRDQFWPAFTQRLTNVAGGRIIWLVIDNLEKYDLPEGDAREFLEFFHAGIRSLTFVRSFLIGLQTSARGAVAADIAEDNIRDAVDLALETYLRRYIAADDTRNVAHDELARHARVIWRMALLNATTAPLPLLAQFLINYVDEIFE